MEAKSIIATRQVCTEEMVHDLGPTQVTQLSTEFRGVRSVVGSVAVSKGGSQHACILF